MIATEARRNGRPADVDTAPRRVERRMGLPSGRAVVGGLLMALAAVGTSLAYAGASADDRVDVLVAARALAPGEVIVEADVQLVDVDVPADVRGLFGAVDAAVGRQLVSPVAPGEFLLASATAPPTEGAETLELAVTVPASRAVGRLQPGERVDVFSTWRGEVTELIAVDARVLEVRGGGDSGFGSTEAVTVRLGVEDFGQVEALVHAQAAGDITMVRAAIGSEVDQLGRQYRARTAGDRAAEADG